MISFGKDGRGIVHFEIVGAYSHRREICLPLEEYLVLVKTTKTMEELRVAVFNWTKERGRVGSAARTAA